MVMLDLDELDVVFRGRWLWSTRRRAWARFRRDDHFGDPAQPLVECVRATMKERYGFCPTRVVLLTHLRYFGYGFNPVSIYYCYDGDTVRGVLLEVNNTPWGERHVYALKADDDQPAGKVAEYRFDKAFHVSPFMPMDMEYRCYLNPPGDQIFVHMENRREREKHFDATLRMRRKPISGWALAKTLVRFPWMTARVIAAVYWQAFRLWWSGCTTYTHPARSVSASEERP